MAAYTISGTVSGLAALFGNVNAFPSTTPPTPGPGEDACTGCPAYIKAPVEAEIRRALQQVRTIKKRTRFVNAALTGLVGNVQAVVQAAVDAIPVPPVFDVGEILGTLTCPLTPVALALDPSLLVRLDPRTLWKKLQDQFRATLRDLVVAYEAALAAAEGADLIKLAKAYFEDLKRTEFDATVLARAVAISAYTLATCPTTHAAGVYAEFDAEIADFDLTGFVPIESLDTDVRDLLLTLGAGETKLEAWRIAATQPPLF